MSAAHSKVDLLFSAEEKDVVLASSSLTRAGILTAAGVAFRVRPPEIDEAALKRIWRARDVPVGAAATELASAKAMAVGRGERNALVLGADQILMFQGVWLDKPASRGEAKSQLLRLAGKTHELHTALAVVRNGTVIWRHAEVARLTMWAFDEAVVENYLTAAGPEILNSVGGYQLEGLGAQLFEAIEGEFFAILGLPLLPLLGFLRRWQP